MKSSEITSIITPCEMLIRAKREYKPQMGLGHIIPASAAQVKSWLRCGCKLGRLGSPDVERIDAIMSEAGFTADYRLSGSKQFAILNNVDDLIVALKQKYGVSSRICSVKDAKAAFEARMKRMQLDQLLRDSWRFFRSDTYHFGPVFDEEFCFAYYNLLTAADVRSAIRIPSGFSVLCTCEGVTFTAIA